MNNNKTTHVAFVIGITLIVLALGVFIYTQEKIMTQGDSIILETRPVDPRDLLRGDYVILRYAIENDEQVTSAIQNLEERSFVYIRLEADANGVGIVREVQVNPPTSLEGLWIRGEVQYGAVRFPTIEQYYVSEGTGYPIERLGSLLHVRVVLNKGDARVDTLLDSNLQPIDPNTFQIPNDAVIPEVTRQNVEGEFPE